MSRLTKWIGENESFAIPESGDMVGALVKLAKYEDVEECVDDVVSEHFVEAAMLRTAHYLHMQAEAMEAAEKEKSLAHSFITTFGKNMAEHLKNKSVLSANDLLDFKDAQDDNETY